MDKLNTDVWIAQHLLYEQARMPVTGMSAEYADGWLIPEHSHMRAQLLYAIKGVMVIQSGQGRWIVPPSRGVWIQAGESHTVKMHGQVSMKTLFIDADWEAETPRATGVLTVSPLLRELIIAMTLAPIEYSADSRERRIARLILDEIRTHATLPLHLPWPAKQDLKNICDQIVSHPDQAKTAQACAHTLAISEKSFHRHFKQQTGITYGQWREQARMLKALEEIAKGQKLLHVALTCGYESQSAF